MLHRSRVRLASLLGATTVAVMMAVPLAGTATAAPTPAASHGTSSQAATTQNKMWATQLDFDDHGTPWSEASLAALKADGLNSVEIDMSWNEVEPSPGTFDFTELDEELANAAAAGMRIIPIFWESGWTGSPASWATSREISSTGITGVQPAWWDPSVMPEYLAYVTDTIAHITNNPGYGGAILNYGFLDAQWDIDNGAGGWAQDDINEFHQGYLPATYKTVAAFNAKYGTSYTSFSQVPAAKPGQPLADVYDQFRVWSMEYTYSTMTADVRKVSNGPLYYYYGGHLANEPDYANNPDTFFQLARKYNVTIILDSAQSTGLALTFGSLARVYHVRVAQEWTAPGQNDQLDAAAVNWLSNYAISLPEGGGEDFFIHDGTSKDVYGFPIYTGWLPTLQNLSGSYPQQPAAVYIDASQGFGNSAGGNMTNVEYDLATLWQRDPSGFAVVTSQEVATGVVKLSQYKAVLPLNGVDSALKAYAADGGHLLTKDSQLASHAPAYAQLSSPYTLQTVPAVAANHQSASITLAEISSTFGYTGSATFSPAGLTLRPGTYHLVDAATGEAVPQAAEKDGDVCAPVDMASATLAQWNMVPGPAPAGTPVPATCPTPRGSGASTVSATATQSSGLAFPGLGNNDTYDDSDLSAITQDGTQAVQTKTTAQSGASTANVYLQVDPTTAVATASDLTVKVTYWASAGQGFQVQYDAPGNAYKDGPTVTSTGSGTWATATVNITGAQLGEKEYGNVIGQDLASDLRLAATNPAAPLIVQSVAISVTHH
ncbi:MAG TPA: beta-galactosidase [Trebonia sp.]|nr:beta-galactosidase [Trebonia sp.]